MKPSKLSSKVLPNVHLGYWLAISVRNLMTTQRSAGGTREIQGDGNANYTKE